MERSSVKIERAAQVDAELLQAFSRLLPQLSRFAEPITVDQLREIVGAPGNTVYVARITDTNDIVGTLTLVSFRVPTGLRAWIEDLVVDEQVRGLGLGEALMRAARAGSQDLGVRSLDLMSNPTRQAAHRLYEKSGFVERDTRVYRFKPQ